MDSLLLRLDLNCIQKSSYLSVNQDVLQGRDLYKYKSVCVGGGEEDSEEQGSHNMHPMIIDFGFSINM